MSAQRQTPSSPRGTQTSPEHEGGSRTPSAAPGPEQDAQAAAGRLPAGPAEDGAVSQPADASAPVSAKSLEQRLGALRSVLEDCVAEIPAPLAMSARARLDVVAERLALGVDHTVAAFFGGTGSGKSSLFNALSRLDFADVGARRPTTSRAAACTWGDDAAALLTFLGVDPVRRIRRESELDGDLEADLHGLVLLDVPDYDSVTREHALQVDRLVPLADVLIWVLDPQKYADAALHDGYLTSLGARAQDIVVVVNQMDTVPQAARGQLLDDVAALLEADGLGGVPVVALSARTGENVAELRRLIVAHVANESHAARTAAAELDDVARRLAPAAAAHPVSPRDEDEADLVAALVTASGARAVAASIESSLARAVPGAVPRPEPPARGAVAAARSRFVASTTQGLPSVWRRSVEAAVGGADVLAAQTAEAVGSVRLPAAGSVPVTLAWWGGLAVAALGVLGGLVCALAGLGLQALAVLGGALGGACVAGTAARARAQRARREAAAYVAQVEVLVARLVQRSVSVPLRQVLERHERLRAALRR